MLCNINSRLQSQLYAGFLLFGDTTHLLFHLLIHLLVHLPRSLFCIYCLIAGERHSTNKNDTLLFNKPIA